MATSLTLTNSISKRTTIENMELSSAYFDDLKRRKEEAISNERIRNGDDLLGTYKVTSDEIPGGMGSVWRVHHYSWNTDLAMKRPKPRYFAEGGPEKKKLFIKECENWIDLGLHPNIVTCYYIREISGVPTIFSEWMDNGSLSDHIKAGTFGKCGETEAQRRILDIAIQAARGLHYSHKNNLIHQDMKPSNLLMSRDWCAKVADFGLAVAQSGLSEDSGTAKVSGYTIAYCPAEQAAAEEPARWMDVYAWALTVLEMYAGKRLWTTGAEAKDCFDRYPPQCERSIPTKMRVILRSCLTEKKAGFDNILAELTEAYEELTGEAYPRPEPDLVSGTPDYLNNKALSFIDLGKTEEAVQLWEEALEIAPNHERTIFNKYLYDWRRGRISGEMIRKRLLGIREQYTDQSLFPEMLRQIDVELDKDWIEEHRKWVMEAGSNFVVGHGVGKEELFVHFHKPDPDRFRKSEDFSVRFIPSRLPFITAIAVTEDGSRCAVAGKEGVVEVYDIRDPERPELMWAGLQDASSRRTIDQEIEDMKTVKFCASEITSLSFSGNGKLLVSANMYIGGALWDAENGKRLLVLPPCHAAAIDSRGERLAIGTWEEHEDQWDLASICSAETYAGYDETAPVDTASLSSCMEGKHASIEIWDVPSLKCKAVYRQLPGDETALRYIETDNHLAAAFYGGAVAVIGDALSEPVLCCPMESKTSGGFLRGAYRTVGYSSDNYPDIPDNTVIAFTPDGQMGLTIGGSICDVSTGKNLYTYCSPDEGPIANLPMFSGDGSGIITIHSKPSLDRKKRKWDAVQWPAPRESRPYASWMLSRIAGYEQTLSREREADLLIETGARLIEEGNGAALLDALEKLRGIPGAGERPGYRDLCRRIARFLTISGVRDISKDTLSEEEKTGLTSKYCSRYMREISFWPKPGTFDRIFTYGFMNFGGSRIPGGSENLGGTGIPTSGPDCFIPDTSQTCGVPVLSHDRRLAAIKDNKNNCIRIWDLESRSLVYSLKDYKRGNLNASPCFSQDDRYFGAVYRVNKRNVPFLAGTGNEEDIKLLIWNMKTGKTAFKRDLDEWVSSFVFSGDGTRIVYAAGSGSRICVVRLSDGTTEKVLTTGIAGVKTCVYVLQLAFSLDGRRLWSLDNGKWNNLKLWDLDVGGEPLLAVTVDAYQVNCLQPMDDDTRICLYRNKVDFRGEPFDPGMTCYTVDYMYRMP